MCNHIRVKILFNDFQVGLEPSWINVNFDTCKTIADVEERIWSKFNVKTRDFKLKLADCRLPSWESVNLLREGDSLHVTANQQQHQQKVNDSRNLAVTDADSDKSFQVFHNEKGLDASKEFRGPEQGRTTGDMTHMNKSKSSVNQNNSRLNEKTYQSDVAYGLCKRKRKKKKRRLDVDSDPLARDPPQRDISDGDLVALNMPAQETDQSQGSQKNRHITFSDEELPTLNQPASQLHVPEVTPSQHKESSPWVEQRTLHGGVPVYKRLKKMAKHFLPENCHEDEVMCTVDQDHGVKQSVIDFSLLKDFQGLPCPGDKIAFQTQEMAEICSSSFSKFKVADVNYYDPISTTVELQLLKTPSENLPAQNDMNNEISSLENKSATVTLQWSSLTQVKLVS